MADVVQFYPTKSLFIHTLTKDINIRDCILDLVDNSVDSYIRNNIKSKRKIIIRFNKDEFYMFDNCGGIPLKELKAEVFRFGAESFTRRKPTIGLYGIGLKRSIFKLGKHIIFETDDGNNYSKLDINVKMWIRKPDDWTLPLSTTSGKSKLKPKQKPYTRIKIPELNEEIIEAFTTKFENELIKLMQIYYTRFLDNKIDIKVNEVNLSQSPIDITIPNDSKPASYIGKYEKLNIRIICWLELKENIKRSKKAKVAKGWKVFMNERLVLLDNTTVQTGWTGNSSQLPKYHSIYNEFRGIVLLNSNTPSSLPINTTKNGFDTENKTYEYVLEKMIETSRPIINFLTTKYDKEKREVDKNEKNIEDHLMSTRKISTKKFSIDSLNKNQEFKPPSRYISLQIPWNGMEVIKYTKPKRLIDAVKKKLKVNSNEEVGSKTFDYYLDLEEIK